MASQTGTIKLKGCHLYLFSSMVCFCKIAHTKYVWNSNALSNSQPNENKLSSFMACLTPHWVMTNENHVN